MSCSNPITTYTNASAFYPSVNRWKVSFACGKCANCNLKSRAEWRLRSFYEVYDKLRKGWFCLFDTLTYSDDNLVRYNDVTSNAFPLSLNKLAFSREHIKLFFKRLRRNLEYAGYNVRDNLRYIVTSEFGISESTRGHKNSHRPHYHCLFLVNLPLDALQFSAFVSKAWKFGITDGVRGFDCQDCPVRKYCRGQCLYKSKQYVANERVVRSGDTSNTLKAVNYVTKYISKDMFIFQKLFNNAELAYRSLGFDIDNDYVQYKAFRRFLNNVMPFHLQSLGFGLSALDYCDLEYVNRFEKIRMPSSQSDVVKEIAIPKYFRNKLWYSYEKIDGKVKWYLNDNGIQHSLNMLDSKISHFISDYNSYNINNKIDLFQLALYNCVYRNTLTAITELNKPYQQYYFKLLSKKDNPILYNCATFKDKMTTGKFIYSNQYIDNETGLIEFSNVQKHKDFVPPLNMVIVNDLVCDYWNGFDKILDDYYLKKKIEAQTLDIIQKQKEIQIDRYKSFGMLK